MQHHERKVFIRFLRAGAETTLIRSLISQVRSISRVTTCLEDARGSRSRFHFLTQRNGRSPCIHLTSCRQWAPTKGYRQDTALRWKRRDPGRIRAKINTVERHSGEERTTVWDYVERSLASYSIVRWFMYCSARGESGWIERARRCLNCDDAVLCCGNGVALSGSSRCRWFVNVINRQDYSVLD